MTLRWSRGMSLAEFEAMIQQHRLEEGEARRRRIPTDDELDGAICVHPFDAVGLEWSTKRRDESLLITVGYRCPQCDQWAGSQTKRVKPRTSAKVVEQPCR